MNVNADHDAQKQLQELMVLIRRLRAPDGCPWDRKQTRQDIGKCLLDESYEVQDALAENDPQHIREELGDLLFQILFIAEIASEAGEFTPADVMADVREKMIRRHPHVFGDVRVKTVEDVKDNWQEIKRREKGGRDADHDLFASVPRSFPALKRAQKITSIASRCGFDWPDAGGVQKKLQEELNELDEAHRQGDGRKTQEELGDIFFTLVNLCRFLSVDAETATSGAIDKFVRRFSYIEKKLSKNGQSPAKATLDEMDALWNEAKEKGM